MVESIDDKIADIADLVGEKGEIVTDRMKTLGFSEYVELMKAVKNTDEETARDILGLGIEEGSFEPHDGAFDWDANMDDDDVEYGIIRYPDTAISYIKNDGSGWMHMYDKSYGFSGPVDKEDMQYASEIEKEKIPSRMFKEQYSGGGTVGTMTPGEQRAAQAQGQETNPLADRNKKTQALQRLGRKNLGGATAQQAADAIDKAQQGEPLTPIQRKAMAHQSQNLDALASNPKTAMQFRNLLNKLNQG